MTADPTADDTRSRARTVRWSLLAGLAGILLAALLLIAAGVSYFVSRTEQRAWQGRQAEAARNAAQTVAAFLQRVQGSMKLIGSLDPALLANDPDLMAGLLERNPALLEIVYVSAQSEALASASLEAPLLASQFTLPQSNWFFTAAGGQVYLGDVQIALGNEPYVILAVPVAEGAVVAARLRMTMLWDLVADIRFGQTGRAYVINREGRIVAHTDPQVVLNHTSIAGRPELEAILSAPDHEWQDVYENFEQVRVAGATVPVPETDWIVVTELPEAEAYAITRSAWLWLSGGLLLFGLLVIGASARLLDQLIFRPLQLLREGVERFGQGDFSQSLTAGGHNEIGQVAEAFNDMAERLRRREAQVIESAANLTTSNRALYEEIVERQRAEEQLRRQNGYLAALHETTLGLISRLDVRDLLEAIASRARQLLRAPHSYICLAEAKEDFIEVKVGTGAFATAIGDRLKPGMGLAGRVWQTGETMVIADYDAWPGRDARMPLGAISALMAVPLKSGARVVGVIGMGHNPETGLTFGDDEVQLLTRFAQLASVALDNARLHAETERQLEEQMALNSIGLALASELELTAMMEVVGERLRAIFRASYVYVALLDKATNLIHFPYYWDQDHRVMWDEPMPYGQGLTSRILASRQPQLINADWERCARELGAVGLTGPMPKASLGVPILIGDEAVGAISVQTLERENFFTDADVRLLTTIAANIGLAIDKARLFEAAQEARQAAEAANQSKSAFLSSVSHELRTPLTSVLGFARIIQKRLEERVFPTLTAPDEKTQRAMRQVSENLHIILAEGERLTTLINNVLDLAKIEAGKVEWQSQPVAIGEVIDRALASTAALFEQRGLEARREVDADLPAIVGDRDRLIQVVVNLISNAVKFTPQGSVTCRARKAPGEILVSVADTGIGIAAEDQAVVFEKFKQVGDTLTDKPTGTGLGLAICKEIVEHHGGRLWVESQAGRGSTFSFSLPVGVQPGAQIVPVETLIGELRQHAVRAAPPAGDGQRSILIVDDDEHMRELLRQELEAQGYGVREAADGLVALSEVKSARPDLLILDILMPALNGFDVAAVLKNDPATRTLPIIVVSVVQEQERGYRLGVDRYFTKPFDVETLVHEVGLLVTNSLGRPE